MKDHITAEEYRQKYLRREKKSKYHNRKTEYNGNIYDSKKEANRAWELEQLIKAGEIVGYTRQMAFRLAGGIIYKADFVVYYPDGHYEIEDVKGMRTQVYQLKKKLMKEKGLEIKEV